MQSPRLSLSGIVDASWRSVKEHIGTFILMSIVAFIPYLVVYIIGMVAMDKSVVLGVLLILLAMVLLFTALVGFFGIALSVVNNQPFVFADLFKHYNKVPSYIGASLLYGIITTGGYLLFILPGIYWNVRFSQYTYFVMDRGEGPVQALKSSWALTNKSFWDVFGMQAVMGAVLMLTLLPLGLGMLIILPFSAIIRAHTYKELVANPVK